MASPTTSVGVYFISQHPLEVNAKASADVTTFDAVSKIAIEILGSQLVLFIELTKLNVYSFSNLNHTERYTVIDPLFIEKIIEVAAENGLFVTERKFKENECKEIESRNDDEKNVIVLDALKSGMVDYVKAGSTTDAKSTEEHAVTSAVRVAKTSSALHINWDTTSKKYCFTDMAGNVFKLADLALIIRIRKLVSENIGANNLFSSEYYGKVDGKRRVISVMLKVLYVQKNQ